MDYKCDIDLDIHRLDWEWQRQAQIYNKWARASVEANRELDNLKEQLTIAEEELAAKKAELDLDIRKNPASYGLEKITEGAISAVILLHDNFKKAQNVCYEYRQKIIDAKYNAGLLNSARDALAHKKAALENEVILWSRGYNAEPFIINEAKKEMEMENKEASQKAFEASMEKRKILKRKEI